MACMIRRVNKLKRRNQSARRSEQFCPRNSSNRGHQNKRPFSRNGVPHTNGRIASMGQDHQDFTHHESKAKVLGICLTGRVIRDTNLSLEWEELKRRRRVPVVAVHADRAVTCNFRFAVVRHELMQISGGEALAGFKELLKPCVAAIRRFVNRQASQNTW